MNKQSFLSRRELVAALAVPPMLASTVVSAEAPFDDAELVALGRQLDSIPAALDHAAEHDEAMALLETIDTLRACLESS